MMGTTISMAQHVDTRRLVVEADANGSARPPDRGGIHADCRRFRDGGSR